MKKTLIIIIAIFFTTSVYASHGNWTCTKKKSVLHDVNKELEKENLVLKRELHQLKNRENIPEETIDFGVEVKRKVKIERNKLNKKFNPKVVQLVLEKFKLNDGDMVTMDTFKRVVKEII